MRGAMSDKPTVQRVIDVLLGLRMLAEGSTYRLDKQRSSSSKPGSVHLVMREETPYDFHRRRIGESRTTDDLILRVRAAEDDLEAMRVRPKGIVQERLSPAEMRQKLIDEFVGVGAADAAHELWMSVAWVRKVRVQHRRHPNTGKELG